jgi:hypothetical protein
VPFFLPTIILCSHQKSLRAPAIRRVTMTPLPIKSSGTLGSLRQAQDFSLRYLRKKKTHHRKASANGLSTQPSFSLSNPSLLPYSSQKRPSSPEEDPVAVICTVGENRYPLVSVTHRPWSSSPTATVRWLAAPGYRQLPTVAAPEWRAVRPLCLIS